MESLCLTFTMGPPYGGAPKYLIKAVQSTQLEACGTAIGHISKRMSTKRLLQKMGWIDIN